MPAPQNRPAAPLPRGSAIGLVATILLTAVLPIAASGAASAWSKRGLDLELAYLPYTAFVPLLLVTAPGFGLRRRRYWAVAYTGA